MAISYYNSMNINSIEIHVLHNLEEINFTFSWIQATDENDQTKVD